MALSDAEIDAIRQISNETILSAHEVFQGANNRSKWIQTDRNRFFIKHYFKHQADPRDRLAVEYAFLEFLNKHEVDSVPRALFCNKEEGFAVYSFIDGIHVDDVNTQFVQHAMNFIKQLNDHRMSSLAHSLSAASEACFSYSDYLDNLQRRIKRLQELEIKDDIDLQAVEFIKHSIIPEANRIKLKQCHNFFIDQRERVLSPSDFGFHNSLLTEQGLVFFDFEYAGWDDPAKLISDFFCQPKVPVSFDYWQMVVEVVLQLLPKNNQLLERLEAVFDIIRLKWCCIVLNEFLKLGATQRTYAHVAVDSKKKKTQLELAQKIITRSAPKVVF